MADESKVAGVDEITLVSQEGEKFVVPRRVAQMSELVKVLTEDAGTDEEVPLMDVKTPVLAKVLEFCKHHVENKLPEIEKVRSQREGIRLQQTRLRNAPVLSRIPLPFARNVRCSRSGRRTWAISCPSGTPSSWRWSRRCCSSSSSPPTTWTSSRCWTSRARRSRA